ncbi:3-oxoacyl-[acyl-carrier-protein] synthase, KASII, partial [hydrothermal vent metagenome]
MRNRVVVTGLGLVTPLGIGVDKTWKNLCAGVSGIGPISRFDASQMEVRIAAEVKDFQPEDFMDKKTARHLELFVQYAVAGARMALDDAQFTVTADNAARIGAITGCGMGGLPTIEKYHQVYLERGAKRITPFFIPMVIPNMGAGQISVIFKLKGPNLSLSTACAAGTHAVGEAYHAIQRGDCEAAVTG